MDAAALRAGQSPQGYGVQAAVARLRIGCLPDLERDPEEEESSAAARVDSWLVLARIFVFWTPAPGRRDFRYFRYLRTVPGDSVH